MIGVSSQKHSFKDYARLLTFASITNDHARTNTPKPISWTVNQAETKIGKKAQSSAMMDMHGDYPRLGV